MGILIDFVEWKRKRELKRQQEKRRFFNPFGGTRKKSTAQKIKEALAKYGSHRKNSNNDDSNGKK